MPNRVSEISLSMGIEIMELLEDHTPTLQDKISVISMLSKTDPALISLIYEESIEDLWNRIEFVSSKSFQINLHRTFRLKGRTYGLKNLEELSVREYSEIEFYLDEGNTPYENLGEVLSVLYRPIVSKTRSPLFILLNIINRLRYKIVVPLFYKNYQIEDFTDAHLKNAEDFYAYCDFQMGYGALNLLYIYKKQLSEDYKLLFSTVEQREEELKLTKSEKEFGDIWGFYYLVTENSQNIFEREAWWGKPLREFYKFLAYNKQKSVYQKHGQ